MPCTHMEQAPIHERHYLKQSCVCTKGSTASYAIVVTKLIMLHANKPNKRLKLCARFPNQMTIRDNHMTSTPPAVLLQGCI